jgi:hypothetical protein
MTEGSMGMERFRMKFIVSAVVLSCCVSHSAFAGVLQSSDPACKGAELETANEAKEAARKGLDQAIAAIDSGESAHAKRLTEWLGVKSSEEAKEVRDALVMARGFLDGILFVCSVKTDLRIGDVYAYVRADKAFVITLSAFFFSAPDRGYSSKAGIVVHEMTHFVLAGASKDPRTRKEYGTAPARARAATQPSAARRNAENLEYFVESVMYGL